MLGGRGVRWHPLGLPSARTAVEKHCCPTAIDRKIPMELPLIERRREPLSTGIAIERLMSVQKNLKKF